jgi:hypothetical protein
MSKNKELSQDYFDRHPSSDSCHITSDGRVFHNVGTAKGYATALKDDTVESFSRTKKVEDIDVEGATDAQETISLADFNPETTKYADAKALLKKLELTAKSQNKEDVFAALTAAQEAAKIKE